MKRGLFSLSSSAEVREYDWAVALREDEPGVVAATEYLPGRFYFATTRSTCSTSGCSDSSISGRQQFRTTPRFHFFTTDQLLVYYGFFADFGPLNVSQLYRYWELVNHKLGDPALLDKAIVHWTTTEPKKRANAAFLASGYAVIELKMAPREAHRALFTTRHPIPPFQDASVENSIYTIRLLDCLNALNKAFFFRLVDFDDFDRRHYEHYEKVENGDISWIVPGRLLAFSKPSQQSAGGTTPEQYSRYFREQGVGTVVRLNRASYDARRFTWQGIDHHDLYFVDGGVPSKGILQEFLRICETTRMAVAVHCKAGLGRTGCLIGAYLVKHYRMTAQEAIGWLRICRPGSVIGQQQSWLEMRQNALWKAGDTYRMTLYGSPDNMPHHLFGIYSLRERQLRSRIVLRKHNSGQRKATSEEAAAGAKVKALKRHESTPRKKTQGDFLNTAKYKRNRTRSKEV